MVATALRRDWWLLALNFGAMIAYTWANGWGMFAPDSSFDVEYALAIHLRIQSFLPFLIAVGLIDLAWAILRVRRATRPEISSLVLSSIVLCGGWIVTFVINRLLG